MVETIGETSDAYFRSLIRRDGPPRHITFKDLKLHWPRLAECGFGAAMLVLILDKVVTGIDYLRQNNEYSALDYFRKNIGVWEELTFPSLTNLGSNNLRIMRCAYAKLNIYPGDAFLERSERQATLKMSEFSAKSLRHTLCADATLGVIPGREYLQACEEHINEIRTGNPENGFRPRDRVDILWAAAIFAAIGQETFSEELIQRLYGSVIELPDIPDMHKTKILTAGRFFNLPAPAFAWPATDQKPSSLRDGLGGALQAIGAKLCQPKHLSGTDISIDLCLQPNETTRHEVLIETGGVSHFVYRDGKILGLDGKTLFMTALMCGDHPEHAFVWVSNFTYGALKSPPEAAETQFQDFLSVLDNLPPGPYYAFPGEDWKVNISRLDINLTGTKPRQNNVSKPPGLDLAG